jgi:hypothetical protein
MVQRPKTAIVALKLRLRESLRRALAAEAKKAGHSLNQEMVRRLERSFTLEEELAEAKARLSERESAATLLKQAQSVLSNVEEYARGPLTLRAGGSDK